MQNKNIFLELLVGCFIGLVGAFLGTFIFIHFFTQFSYFEGINNLKSAGSLGKLITLGAVLNIIIFFIFLKYDKEIIARGIVLGTFILTIITFLV